MMNNNEEPLDFSWATYKDPDQAIFVIPKVSSQKTPEQIESERFIEELLKEKELPKQEKSLPPKKSSKFRFVKDKKMIITALSMTTASLMLITAMKISASSKKSLKEEAINNLANYYEQKDTTEEYADQEFAKEVEEEFAKSLEIVEEPQESSEAIPNTLTEEEKNELNIQLQENKKKENNSFDNNIVYSDLCVDVCEKAANYLTDDVFDMVSRSFFLAAAQISDRIEEEDRPVAITIWELFSQFVQGFNDDQGIRITEADVFDRNDQQSRPEFFLVEG